MQKATNFFFLALFSESCKNSALAGAEKNHTLSPFFTFLYEKLLGYVCFQKYKHTNNSSDLYSFSSTL